MKDISVAMMTFDRLPRENYLAQTLENLERAGVFTSERLAHFALVDSGSPFPMIHMLSSTPRGLLGHIEMHRAPSPRVPTHNAVETLHVAAGVDASWVLFLEDDIDVCANFLDSVGAWLDEHASDACPVYTFGANYATVKSRAARGFTSWEFPLPSYYGTLAFAIRPADARRLADWWWDHVNVQTYDLLMAAWGREQMHVGHFLASVPCFVQHIGRESSIRPGGEFHTYDSWPGQAWSYRSKQAVRA